MLTAYDGKSITYDAIGNPNVWHNSTGDWNLSWANGRQLTTASNDNHRVSYTYDLAGVRDSKTVDGVTYNYITQNGQVVRQTWGRHVMDFIYDNTGKPYAVKYDGTLYYYVLNLQGDVIAIVTTWGAAYGTYTYDAWGNVISQSGSIASINPIRYRGYYYDSETGLYYLGSRYYDPAVKRFMNADGAAFATINPYGDGLTDKNYFAYCDNNPTSRSDDGGEFWNLVVGAAVGGIMGALSSYATGGSKTDIAIGALSGAANGLVAATGLGAVHQALISGSVSVVGSVASSIRSRESVGKTIAKAAISGAVGLASSVAGSAVGKVFTGKMQQAGKLLICKGRLGRSAFTRAASRQLVRQGKKYINLGRGISSVLGTASTWRTTTAISYVLSQW